MLYLDSDLSGQGHTQLCAMHVLFIPVGRWFSTCGLGPLWLRSRIRYPAYQTFIHNSSEIITVMMLQQNNCMVGGPYNMRNRIKGSYSIRKVENHCA